MNTSGLASSTDHPLNTVEDLDYNQGGYHPVHLGDSFDNNRYHVIHKLGYGGYATVWLARDKKRHRYVALKILTARSSYYSPEVNMTRLMRHSPDHQEKANINLLLNSFLHTGPNGNHLCLTSPVRGPSLRNFTTLTCQQHNEGERMEKSIARSVSSQVAHSVAYLHHNNIIHGDLTSANILLEIANMDDWTEQEVYQRLGNPCKQELSHADLLHANLDTSVSTFPKYTVASINMLNVSPAWLSPNATIIDFGIALRHGTSSLEIGTPRSYCAPELLFHSSRSKASDIWALGCLIFEVHTGCSLFAFSRYTPRSKMVQTWVETLGGHFPYEWQSTLSLCDAHSESMGEPKNLLLQRIMNIGPQDDETAPISPSASQSNRASIDQLVSMAMGLTTSEADEVLRLAQLSNQNSLDYNIPGRESSAQSSEWSIPSGQSLTHLVKVQSSMIQANTHHSSVTTLPTLHQSPIQGVPPPAPNVIWQYSPYNNQKIIDSKDSKISVDEAVSLEGLIRSCLEYRPEDRILASEITKHVWFSNIFSITSDSTT